MWQQILFVSISQSSCVDIFNTWLLRCSPIKFACVALKTRNPSVLAQKPLVTLVFQNREKLRTSYHKAFCLLTYWNWKFLPWQKKDIKCTKKIFKNSSKTFGIRIFQGTIFLGGSEQISDYYLHYLNLTSLQNCYYWYHFPFPNRPTRCNFQTRLHWSLLPVPSLDHFILFVTGSFKGISYCCSCLVFRVLFTKAI